MIVQQLQAAQAQQQALKLPFALLYSRSSVTLGRCPAEVDWSAVTEARFFNEQEEIWFVGGKAYRQTAGEDVEIKQTVRLLPEFGENLTLCRCYQPDEDGQLTQTGMRLLHWKGAQEE